MYAHTMYKGLIQKMLMSRGWVNFCSLFIDTSAIHKEIIYKLALNQRIEAAEMRSEPLES